MFEHLVLGGGLEAGLVELGAAAQLEADGHLDVSALKSVHATSAGAFAAALLTAGLSAATVERYVVDRPWQALVTEAAGCDREHPRKGLLDGTVFRDMFSSVFRAAGLQPAATLSDMYAASGTVMTVYTVDAATFETVVLSAASHPDLEVWRAVHMSCAYPALVEPAYLEGRVYVDGGILCNFPLAHCLEHLDKSAYGTVLAMRAPACAAGTAELTPDSDVCAHMERIIAGLTSLIFRHGVSGGTIPDGVRCLDLSPPPTGRLHRIANVSFSREARAALVAEGRQAALRLSLPTNSDGRAVETSGLRGDSGGADARVGAGVLLRGHADHGAAV